MYYNGQAPSCPCVSLFPHWGHCQRVPLLVICHSPQPVCLSVQGMAANRASAAARSRIPLAETSPAPHTLQGSASSFSRMLQAGEAAGWARTSPGLSQGWDCAAWCCVWCWTPRVCCPCGAWDALRKEPEFHGSQSSVLGVVSHLIPHPAGRLLGRAALLQILLAFLWNPVIPPLTYPAWMHKHTQLQTEMGRDGRMRPEDYSSIIMNYLFIIPINSEKSLPPFLLP